MLTIAIAGAAGRMGKRVAALAMESGQLDLVAALEHSGHEALGQDAGELAGSGAFGLAVTDTLVCHADVLIDFSLPEGTLEWLNVCRSRGIPMVTGTTGLTESQAAEIADAAGQIAIVKAANMSVGINVLMKVVSELARTLGRDYDVEIAETHHRFKADAPSGTAVMLAKAVCAATARDYGDSVVFGRGGRQARKPDEIGIHSARIGDTVGEHAVAFGNLGETVTISHCAHSRDTFANGALKAAQWVVAKPAGLYSMQAVLGL